MFKFSLFRTMVQPLASDGNASVEVSSMLDLDAVDVVITLTGSINFGLSFIVSTFSKTQTAP